MESIGFVLGHNILDNPLFTPRVAVFTSIENDSALTANNPCIK